MASHTRLQGFLLADLPRHRRCSYLCFALALCVALGSYQFVSPVKTAIFLDLVGTQHEPVARSLVLVVLVPVLFLYGVVASAVGSSRRLVLAVCGFYALAYVATSAVLLASAGRPGAWFAWALYYITETRSVVVMPMIWSVVADASTTSMAKRAFPPMFALIQLGGIAGSLVAVRARSLGGEVGLLLLQAAAFGLVAGLAWLGCHAASADVAEAEQETSPLRPADGAEDAAVAKARDAPGLRLSAPGRLVRNALCEGFEGLWLLLSQPYAFGVFWVSYANLMPRTILDYQNSVLVKEAFPSRMDQIAFLGNINLAINSGVALLTLLGTSSIVEAVGIGGSLLMLPAVMLCCVLALCTNYSLWTSVWTLMVSCVVAYGLNSPCKEMLYVRTSREVKIKAKAWSEMYGNQLMKLLGAQVNLWVNRDALACEHHCFQPMVTIGTVAAWVSLWAAAAAYLRRVHAKMEAEDAKSVC